jgi:hypothetical protein
MLFTEDVVAFYVVVALVVALTAVCAWIDESLPYWPCDVYPTTTGHISGPAFAASTVALCYYASATELSRATLAQVVGLAVAALGVRSIVVHRVGVALITLGAVAYASAHWAYGVLLVAALGAYTARLALRAYAVHKYELRHPPPTLWHADVFYATARLMQRGAITSNHARLLFRVSTLGEYAALAVCLWPLTQQ